MALAERFKAKALHLAQTRIFTAMAVEILWRSLKDSKLRLCILLACCVYLQILCFRNVLV